MSKTLNKSLLAKIERELEKDENTKVWLQTASGDIVELEYELAWQSPLICDELMEFGVGLTRNNPIRVSPGVKAVALEMIFEYFRFSQAPGRSDKECELFVDEFVKKDTITLCKLVRAARFLQHKGLMDMICRALARNIENSSPETQQDLFKSFEERVKGEELEPQKNPNGDLRTRLSKKLLAKQKKELKEAENVKKAVAEVEAQKHEDRSIDDLISFINGGDGDTQAGGLQTSKKKKKKNRSKGKEKKKTSSSSTFFSAETCVSKKVIENREDINASYSANHRGSIADSFKLLGTRDESFDVEGNTDDDDLDPALLDEIDREVKEFAIRLMSVESQKRT